jgi:hypothetical protein
VGLVTAAAAWAALGLGVALAEPDDAAAPAATAAPDAAAAVAGAKKKKGGIIVLDAIKVEGRIQKPQAFYILQRTNLNFTSLELERSFLPDIEKSVLSDPF